MASNEEGRIAEVVLLSHTSLLALANNLEHGANIACMEGQTAKVLEDETLNVAAMT